MTTLEQKVEQLAEQLHIWYLEATKNISRLSFNKKAQRSYAELTNEQKYIDKYIAEKLLTTQIMCKNYSKEFLGREYIMKKRLAEEVEEYNLAIKNHEQTNTNNFGSGIQCMCYRQ